MQNRWFFYIKEVKALKQKINMTEGALFGNIVAYAVPIILTSLLQMFFNTVDRIVVGQFCGSNSVGAIGATSSLTNLLTNFFIGFSVGSGVSTAHAVGAGDNAKTRKTVHASFSIAIVCGVVMTLLGVFASGGILKLMGTPDEVIVLSTLYMKIYFSGAVAVLIYNFGAAILRAVGETKKPLIYLSIAGVMNVVLNIIFVTVFHMDVAGVALATILSQVLSAILVLIELVRRKDACRLIIGELRFHKNETIKIFKMGIPTGIQSCLFSVSNVLIQSAINSFGIAAVAGNSAASSVENLNYVSMNAFQQTSMNFTGQNVGAGKIDRVKKVFATCMFLVSFVGIIIGLLITVFGKPILGVYVGDDLEAINAGMQKLMCVNLPYFLCGMMEITTGTLRGMGYSVLPMLTAIGGVCVFRIGWQLTVFNLPALHSLQGLFISYPISWVMTGIANLILYSIFIKKFEKNKE